MESDWVAKFRAANEIDEANEARVCTHPARELRKKLTSNGAYQFLDQCLRSGQSSQAIPHRDPRVRNSAAIPDFDGSCRRNGLSQIKPRRPLRNAGRTCTGPTCALANEERAATLCFSVRTICARDAGRSVRPSFTTPITHTLDRSRCLSFAPFVPHATRSSTVVEKRTTMTEHCVLDATTSTSPRRPAEVRGSFPSFPTCASARC